MISQDYIQLQDFQYFIVIDFEATCDKEVLYPQEIIEFPSVIVNAVTGELQACFQAYVKPTYQPKLTDFCKELTGIQQIQVDNGVSLTEALEIHDRWLQDMGIKYTNFAVVTWSNCDCEVILENECKLKGIGKPDYFNRWINLRVPFSNVFRSKCNLKKAVEMAGLVWEGRQHCGFDDAINTANLLVHLMRRGYNFSITNSLMSQQQQLQHSPPSYQPYFQLNYQHYFPPNYQHCFPQQQQQSPLDYQHYYLQQQCPADCQVYHQLHQCLPNHHELGSDLKSIDTAYLVQRAAEEWSRAQVLTSNGCILD